MAFTQNYADLGTGGAFGGLLGSAIGAYNVTSGIVSATTANTLYVDATAYLQTQANEQQRRAAKAAPVVPSEVEWLRSRVDEICWH